MPAVITGSIQRLATWLCLALTLFTGVVPAQGMVLCLEADGCVRIEIKTGDGDCGGCDAHLGETGSAAVEVPQDHDGVCPCVDLDVPGATETPRPRGQALDRLDVPLALSPFACRVVTADGSSARCAVFAPRPRPPDTLRLIRSVVLLR